MSKGRSPVVSVLARRALVLGLGVAALVVPAGPARPAAAAAARAAPVASLQPAATARLWRQLVRRPATAARPADCRPTRLVFYAPTDWLRLATHLAADANPCAQYFVSVPPLAGAKTTLRPDQAWRIRALGPAFHALAEINYNAWSGWVASNGGSWFDAGVEARRRMAQAGYDVAAGDTWALNEVPSAARRGDAATRQAIRDFVHGLYQGDGSTPPAKGVVFVIGVGSGTTSLNTYKANIQGWMRDSAFWSDMSLYVGDWSQEVYGNVKTYAVPGASLSERRDSLNDYLQHALTLANAGPAGTTDAARAFLQSAYSPLGNAAWAWSASFGWTDVPFQEMQDYVSAQTYAMRSFPARSGLGVDRFGFVWSPNNLAGKPKADFGTQTVAILDRLAAAIHDSGQPVDAADPGVGACGPAGQNLWCTAAIDDAAFNTKWKAFAAWSPPGLVFTTPSFTLAAGVVSPQITFQLQVLGVVQADPLPVTVTLASSSPKGLFSTAPAGPWTPTLSLTIPPGSTSASFFYQDTGAGTAAITASAPGHTAGKLTATIGASTITTLSIAPPSASILVGDSATFTARGTDSFGNAISPAVSWSLGAGTPGALSTTSGATTTYTSDPEQAGSGTLVATLETPAGTLSATAAITVAPRPLQVASVRWRPGRKHLVLTFTVRSTGKAVPRATIRATLFRDRTPVVPVRRLTDADGRASFTVLPRPSGGCYRVKINRVTAASHTWDGRTPANRYCWKPRPARAEKR